MREIKFRAWDSMEKKFISDVYISLDGWHYTNSKDDHEPHLIIEQYTGLRDKNGKEIYEGDKIHGNGLDYYDSKKTIAIVEWDETGGWYPFANNQDEAPYPYPENCEIIGNIHECEL